MPQYSREDVTQAVYENILEIAFSEAESGDPEATLSEESKAKIAKLQSALDDIDGTLAKVSGGDNPSQAPAAGKPKLKTKKIPPSPFRR